MRNSACCGLRLFIPRYACQRCIAIGWLLLIISWDLKTAEAEPVVAEAARQPSRSWALLIGAEKYHRAPQLRFTVNDVCQLSATLHKRGGYPADGILQMTDQASNPRFQPLKASLMAELPEWLKKPEPADTIIVYFSGHGFRDKDGRMYLAPLDCDPANPAATGIPVQWFREQIAGCRAGFKLLLLDTCHAGSEKGDDDDKSRVVAKDIGEPFKDLEGVVTLASSTAAEKSQLWEEKQQSLFSYWLNQGMRGHADENSDGAVDIDELYKYVYRNVTQTAKAMFPLPQTPVRIVRSGTPDVPTVVGLQPQTLRQLIADMAEQIGVSLEQKRLAKVGVLEFTNDTKLGELLGADFGLLGRYCAEDLERRLVDGAAGKYNVVNRRSLQKALTDQGFQLSDLGSNDSLKQLSARAGGMPVLALGTLSNRAGRVVCVKCKLLRTEDDELAGVVGGVAQLNESEWAMLGRSVQVKPEDRRTDPGVSVPRQSTPDDVVHRIDRRSEGPHPLLDPNFPYRVKVVIGGRQREPFMKGNDCYVSVRKGEVYEIWIENRSGKLVLMRLLVDGLNTLPEKETTKGITTFLVGKRVNLDEARHWLLDPADHTAFAVRGFVTETGVQGRLREFLVVDAEQSLAARQKFTDQIGLITAAFYAPNGGSRGLGTGLGQERGEDIREQGGYKPGNLLGVVHIRYVDADAINNPQ